MKKTLSILIAFILVLLFCCSCKENNVTQSEDSTGNQTNSKSLLSKIGGEITAASDFSDGLAFVCLEGNREKTYCINTKGEIVFQLDKTMDVNGVIFEKFHNGYALIDGAVCDTTGKLIYPKDVGATKFSLLAIEDGYILTEVKNSTYNSTDIKIGIMNTSFQWILEPSAEIGSRLKDLPIESLNTKSYYKNGIVCFDVDGYGEDVKYLYLNVKTGEIYEDSPHPLPAEKWVPFSNGYGLCEYQDYDENITLDISAKYSNVYLPTAFINGKAAILLLNKSEQEYYYTVINEKGEFQFEPVSCGKGITEIEYDGKYTLMNYDTNSVKGNVKCYNNEGKLMCDIIRKENTAYSYSLSDGIVKIGNGTQYYYCLPNGKRLF